MTLKKKITFSKARSCVPIWIDSDDKVSCLISFVLREKNSIFIPKKEINSEPVHSSRKDFRASWKKLCLISLPSISGGEMATDRRKNACVVVLGDLCRSPRIRNQALSLAEEGVHVRLVGYDGGSPPTDHERIRPVYMTPFPGWVSGKLPKVLSYALKALWQALTLLCSLLQSPWSRDAPDLLLLQNPPSIPSLAVCHVYCTYIRLGRCKFVVDWHNYGYSIMALQHGGSSPLVRLARWMERNFGKSAAANFSVTEAMKRDLEENWGVRGVVTLYDRAPEQFKPLSKRERADFLKKMKANHGDFFEKMDDCGFVISSTSWTEDEVKTE